MLGRMIDDKDKVLMEKNFEEWININDIRNYEYYNGDLYFICNDGDLLCEKCLKENKEWIDDLIGFSFLQESYMEECSHCYEILGHHNAIICPECNEILDKNTTYTNKCCIENMKYLIAKKYEF